MLTRGKRARMQLEDSSIEEGNEALPLLSLPDVPLVNVLSRLSPKDLWAVGQASPRLGALTRAHTSLWVAEGNKGGSSGKLYFGDVGSILALLRVAPPVDELHYEVRRPLFLPPYVVSLTRKKSNVLKMEVRGSTVECCAAIIRELGGRLQRVGISRLDHGLEGILSSLQEALSVKSIELSLVSYFDRCAFKWPQTVVLPRLNTIILLLSILTDDDEDEEDSGPHSTLLDALRSILLAHRRQLRDVRISSQLLPLLDSCPSRLQQMTVVARQGFDVGAGLQRLRGLNRLTILQLGDEQVEQVDTLLKSCRSPLENLILLLCCDQTLQTVGSIGLTSLRYILLFCGYTNQWALGSLEVALAGLPNLRTLIVGGLDDPLQELSRVPASAIPNLTLLVFQEKGRFDMDSPADYTGFRDCQDLVLRAPKSLHVGASFGGGGCIVFCRHATDEFTVASCPTCGREETEISTVAIVQVQ